MQPVKKDAFEDSAGADPTQVEEGTAQVRGGGRGGGHRRRRPSSRREEDLGALRCEEPTKPTSVISDQSQR